ncbi:MAG: LysE family transporter [Thermoprotei archaeon]
MAAPPGPINIMMFNETIRHGQRRSVQIGLGATTADFVFYLIVSQFGRYLLDAQPVRLILYSAGIVLLVYLSARLLQAEFSSTDRDFRGAGYMKGLSVGLTNPLQIGWWTAVGLPLLALLGSRYFAVGFFSGILSWVYSFTKGVALYRTKVYSYFGTISRAAAILLLLFAAFFVYQLLHII